MVILIHGDDGAASRNYSLDLLKKYQDVIRFSGDELVLSQLIQVLQGTMLFSEEKVIFIENLFSQKKAKNDLLEICTFLNENSSDATIFLWEKSTITKKNLSLFPKATIKECKLPQVLFATLDAVKPHNPALLPLFHQALQNVETELLFYMLVRHFRILLTLSPQSLDTIDEVKRLAPWQKGKLEKQRALFSQSLLVTSYQKLYIIEKGYKTGSIPSLTQAIDIFLLEL